MRTIIAIFCAVIFCSVAIAAIVPQRSKGISMHMLPKRVADLSGQRWGFTVTYADYLKPEPEEPVLQTSKDLFSFVRKQDQSVQANGVWIVITNPDAYSEQEKKLLNEVKILFRKEKIPLFICRGSELPNGWKRYDNAS